jgi:hypothetical protein
MTIHDTPDRAAPAAAGRTAGHRAALVKIAPYLLLGALPVAWFVGSLLDVAGRNGLAFDYHHFFYPQARELLHGGIPATAYPPLTTLLYAPFSLLPLGIGDVVVTATMIGCVVATLMLLGVRDWRCYGASLLWAPVYSAVQTANLSLVLALGVAALWRLRDRGFVAGGLTAFMIATKLFLWPVLVWLLATRRWRAAASTVALGVLASAAAWAVIDFDTVSRFPDLVRGNVLDNGTKPYTIATALQQLGVRGAISYAACWTVGAVVLAGVVRAARQGRDAVSLTLTLAAALILSPVVWSHYLALLLVPVALVRPRFSALWLAPVPLWLCPPVGPSLAQKLLLLAVGGAVIAACVRDASPRPASTPAMR